MARLVQSRGLSGQGQGDNLGDVSLGTKDLDLDSQGLTQLTHGAKTLLVVGASTTDKDANFVGDKGLLELGQSADDTLEG